MPATGYDRAHPELDRRVPGDILTQPASKIFFNAPYDSVSTYHLRIVNTSGNQIAFAIKTTNIKRLKLDPPCGVLDVKESVLMAVTCDAFTYEHEDTSDDRITVEWTNTPAGVSKHFRREYFMLDRGANIRRKNIAIEYNP